MLLICLNQLPSLNNMCDSMYDMHDYSSTYRCCSFFKLPYICCFNLLFFGFIAVICITHDRNMLVGT